MTDQRPVSELQKRIDRLAALLADHPDPAVADALADLTRIAPAFDAWRPISWPPKPPTKEEAEARLRAIAEAQGKLGKATFETLLGSGKNLWGSDEEFEQFLENTRKARRGE